MSCRKYDHIIILGSFAGNDTIVVPADQSEVQALKPPGVSGFGVYCKARRASEQEERGENSVSFYIRFCLA